MDININTHIIMNINININVNTNAHTHTHAHTHIYIYTHTFPLCSCMLRATQDAGPILRLRRRWGLVGFFVGLRRIATTTTRKCSLGHGPLPFLRGTCTLRAASNESWRSPSPKISILTQWCESRLG